MTLDYDILVVGAGSAGCSAAIAAGLQGGKTLLIERYGFLGGVSTQSLDTFYGFFTPGDTPAKVVGGVPDMVVDRLAEKGEMFLRPNTYGAGTGVNYNPEYLKLLWEGLVGEAGADMLLHSRLESIERDGAGYRAAINGPGGTFTVTARRVIDTSGDAHAAHILGAELEEAGTVDAAQTFTTTFRMSNVDLDAYAKAGGKKMLQDAMNRAVDEGSHPLPRRSGSVHEMVQPGCIATVAVRVPFASPFDVHELSRAEVEGRRQAFVYERFLRERVAGFESAKIIGMSSPQIGIRESRRLRGAYRLTREDCLGQARFDDAVLVCGAPIEDHRLNRHGEDETEWAYVPDGGTYQVPYRCFHAPGIGGLWVAGRCFSADHSAQASCRSMGQTMAMGQAVGVAAALAMEQDCAAADVPVGRLRARLRDLGAVLERPQTEAHIGRDDWFRNRERAEPVSLEQMRRSA